MIGLGLLVGTLIVALLAFDLWRKHGELEFEAFRETRNLALVLGAHAAGALDSVDGMLKPLATPDTIAPPGGRFDPARFERQAKLVLDNLPQVTATVLLDATGHVMAATLPRIRRGTDLSHTDYFRHFATASRPDPKAFIGAPLRGRLSKAWLVPMARGVWRPDGAFMGVIATAIEPSYFVRLFDALEKGRFSAVTMLQRDGVIVARSPDQARFVGRSIARGELVRKLIPAAPSGSARYSGVLNGRDLILSYVAVRDSPYVINVTRDAGEVFGPWYSLLWTYALIAALVIVTIAATIWLIGRDRARRQAVADAARIRGIIDGMSSWVALFDLDGCVVEINRAALDGAGLRREDVIGRRYWDTYWYSYSAEAREHVRDVLSRAAAGEPVREDIVNQVGDGRFVTADAAFHPVRGAGGRVTYVIASGVDVTERKQLEERLRRSQRIEAMGQLAGGIAHDFNNLLSAIKGFASFLVEDLAAGSAQQRFAQRIVASADRGRDLVGQILTFSRSDRPALAPVDLGAAVRSALDLFEATLPATTRLVFDAGTAPLCVRGNETQIARAVANLCINASDALDGRPGDVSIGLAAVRPDDADYRRPMAVGALVSGQAYARLDVADNGSGIAPEDLARIFEPFYSTKGPGRGTGLGLAVVHGVVVTHDGACAVESVPGQGTRFSIWLPLADAAAPAAESAPQRDARRSVRVLVVDDEPDAVEMLTVGLRRHGCDVVGHDDPLAALRAFEADPHGWDAVVTDRSMPVMTGPALAAKLRALQPDVAVILCTAFDDASRDDQDGGAGFAAVFIKPVEPASIADRIKEIVAGRIAEDAGGAVPAGVPTTADR